MVFLSLLEALKIGTLAGSRRQSRLRVLGRSISLIKGYRDEGALKLMKVSNRYTY